MTQLRKIQASDQEFVAELAGPTVLVVYEDFVSGLRAKCFLDSLPVASECQGETRLSLWRSDLLSDPFFGEQAAKEAAEADVILMSWGGGEKFQFIAQEWLNRWFCHKKNQPYAIGVLLPEQSAGSRASIELLARLREFARTAGVELFHGYCQLQEASAVPGMGQSLKQHDFWHPALDARLRNIQPHPWGGINE